MVSLRPITDANREEAEALAVTPDQRRFVSGVRESLLEAAAEPGAHAVYWAVYDDETPVGFVMIADEVDGPDYIAHFLWKLLIDERYQRRGFGTETLDLIVEFFRDRGVGAMWTSAGQGEGSPVTFYERYGFERTGELHGNEILLRLDISGTIATCARSSSLTSRRCSPRNGRRLPHGTPRANGSTTTPPGTSPAVTHARSSPTSRSR